VNFDSVSTSGGWGLVPASYAGYTWTSSSNPTESWEVVTNSYYRNTYGQQYDFPTNPNAAYNDSGAATMTITSANLFNFTSAYFWGWTGSVAPASSLTVSGYNGATLIGSTPITLASSPALVNLNFSGIDKIEFTTTAGKYWLMDNANMAPVPVPPSVWLLGSGLVGLVGLRRKFTNYLKR
jgi:hypothetical protein